jgi:hypothetical protein
MFKEVFKVDMSVMEFAWKVTISLIVIMPVCVGGIAFGSYQLTYNLSANIPLIVGIGAFIGTFLGFLAVVCLIKLGH